MFGISLWSPGLVPSHFRLFPALKESFSGHRFACDKNVKHATITWPRNGNMTVYTSELDKLTICCGRYLKPSRGCVEKLLTKDTFILCCQLPLFNSYLWFVDTVNLISGPLSYYKVYGKKTRRNGVRHLIRLVRSPSASRLERYSFTSLTSKRSLMNCLLQEWSGPILRSVHSVFFFHLVLKVAADMGFFSKKNKGNKKLKGPIKTPCPRVGLSFFSHFLRDYFINTSLHGLRYIAEDGRHWTER